MKLPPKMNSRVFNNINLKTYASFPLKSVNLNSMLYENEDQELENEMLTTKNAVKFLLEGTLRLRVCRYCLKISTGLSELDEILEIGINGSLHEVTIKDMVASFHPVKVTEDPNFPNKICEECLNRTLSSYLYVQQCDRAERALHNCFDDIYDKFLKLDPVEPVKKRGKRKLNPNPNVLYAEHLNAIDYAEPAINMININSIQLQQTEMNPLECPKCWQLLPSVPSLINHEKTHPKSMWYCCRLCGKSFMKRNHLKKHIKELHKFEKGNEVATNLNSFKCNECSVISKDLGKHLQHIEKHKFTIMLEHLLEKKMNKLCSLCLNDSCKMVNMDEVVYLHGGYPGLTGDQSIYNIVSRTFSNMTFDNPSGTKICYTCFNHTINSYVFNQKIQYIRHRLETCVSFMIDNLNTINDSCTTIMVEISENIILPRVKYDSIETIIDDTNLDEAEFKVEVLEDEFRIESATDSEAESESSIDSDNPARVATRVYTKKPLLNGYQYKRNENKFKNVCSEFLTFKKKVKPKRKLKYVYTCPICDKRFVSDYFLKKHIIKHVHRKVKCRLCFRQFKSKFYLFEHMKMIHILKRINFVTCNMCGRTFSNLNKLKLHEVCHRFKQCHLCDKFFKSQQYFDIHNQRHAVKFQCYNNKLQQTCSFCEKACSNENELSLHVNKVHLQIKPYNCDMCEKQFYTEYNLNSHKKLHSLYSREICTFCKKMFKCRKDLVVHVRKHIGIKPHQCPVCRQSFYSDNKLKQHMKLFHGGKFCCRLCKAVVPSQSDLRAHINVVHSSM